MTKRRISILCLLLFGWLDGSEATNCSIPPIYVDMHSRQVQGIRAKQFGSYVGVGSPVQNMSLWPSLKQNDTMIAEFGFCDQSNLTNCSTSTGGTFDPSFSSTWTPSQTSKSILGSLAKAGKDTIHLFTHLFYFDAVNDLEITELPIELMTGGSHVPGIMGLGAGSSLINRLAELGQIAGRSYSLYLGTGFRRAGGSSNGSNVLGGYDAGRFKDKVHTYPMDLTSQEYLSVNVTDIIIDHPTLQRISIMDDESFQARITTDRYPMIFPVGIRRKFKAATGAIKSNQSDSSFMIEDSTFNSSMTIVLSDGFNVTLPPQVLRSVDTGLTAITSLSPNYTGTYYLSSAWLTQVYLMLDFETKQFHLGKAIEEPNFIAPQIFCPGDTPFSRVEEASNEQKKVSNRPSLLGAILGGTFAGVAVLLIGWLCLLHRRKQRLAGDSEEGKLRHEPIMFFSDEELRQRRQESIEGSTKTIELKSLSQKPIPPAPTHQREEESASQIAETEEPDTDREASLDLAAILRNHSAMAQSPTVLHSPTAVISRSVSPVSAMSTKSEEHEEKEEDKKKTKK